MYVIIRLLIKYNVLYWKKELQYTHICYIIILQLLHYFTIKSTTIPITIITVKYIIQLNNALLFTQHSTSILKQINYTFN